MITKLSMQVYNCGVKTSLGANAGKCAADYIKKAILKKGQANIIMATGTAQYETLKVLIDDQEIDWSKVVMFHLDEYIGIEADHKASFRKFLTERFLDFVPPLKKTHLINGFDDVDAELDYLNQEIVKYPIDLALIGIGENGHLAFNDPPADFETDVPFIKVQLDEACRTQQVKEGWFPDLEAVPTHAVSMSIKHMLKSTAIVASIPDFRKAEPVYNTIFQAIDPQYPSTMLRLHRDCHLFLDGESSSLIPNY